MQFNEASEIHKEKEQRLIKDFINIISYFGREHLLKGTDYYNRFISHVGFFKLKHIETKKITKNTKNNKGIVSTKVEEKKIFYTDPKFECLKISKTKKSDKEPLPPPAKTSQVENIFVHFSVENKIAYTHRRFKDAPKKFFAPTKSILNFFTILLDVYVGEIISIYKDIETSSFTFDYLVKEGKFSKLVHCISKIEGRNILERVKFDSYNNEMANSLFEIELAYSGAVVRLLLNLTSISSDHKNQLTKLFVNFIYVLMMHICTQKATRAEKKYTTDLDCFLNFLQYYHFLHKHELNFNINEFMTFIREGDKKIVICIAKSKCKDEVTVEDKYFENRKDFIEYEEQFLKKTPKLNSSKTEVIEEIIKVKNSEENEEEEEEENEDEDENVENLDD